MSKAISFHISSIINETWYKVTAAFGSFKIGPNSWLNWHLAPGFLPALSWPRGSILIGNIAELIVIVPSGKS